MVDMEPNVRVAILSAKNDVEFTTQVNASVYVDGSVAQLIAPAVIVKVKAVGVLRSSRFVGY